jgi:hypothetical protein
MRILPSSIKITRISEKYYRSLARNAEADGGRVRSSGQTAVRVGIGCPIFTSVAHVGFGGCKRCRKDVPYYIMACYFARTGNQISAGYCFPAVPKAIGVFWSTDCSY